MTLLLQKEQLPYTACYCEENIYLLCKYIQQNHCDVLERCTVVFISNDNESFPMWLQRAAKNPERMVVWDYHVILLIKNKSEESGCTTTDVYDFDTTLPFPCTLTDYIDQSFRPYLSLPEELKRRFRLVPAELFIQYFASDRSHMRSQDGSYFSPPPFYSPFIASDGNTMTLPQYRNMALSGVDTDKFGKVVLQEHFFDMV